MIDREDIIRLRDECDEWAENHLQCKGEYHPDFHTVSDERFATLVAAAEREAIAQMIEDIPGCSQYFPHVVEAVYARGETA